MKRGEVWVARFRPSQKHEVGKARPCVVLQSDELNQSGMTTVLVLPLTSKLISGAEALRVRVSPRDRLLKPSWVMVEKLRTIDRNNLSDGAIAKLASNELMLIEERLQFVLGFKMAGLDNFE